MTTKVIRIHCDVGSLDWELPKGISEDIENLPEEAQEYILKTIEMHLHGHLCVLMGALRSGPKAELSFEIIRQRGQETAEMLRFLLEDS